MVKANSHGDVSNSSNPGEFRHQQHFSLEPQMEVHFTDLEQAKVVVPESDQPLSDRENEFRNSPTTIKDDESSKRCGLLETVPCVFATGNYKMDLDGITETPSITLKRDSSLEVEKLCTYPSPFVAEEPSLRERIAAGSTEELTCSTRIQSGASSLQNEEGDVDVLEDYGTYWNVHVHVETDDKGISVMERSTNKDNERSKELELQEEIHDGH
ncbi:unnamed protein product [Sphagnum tenellum]